MRSGDGPEYTRRGEGLSVALDVEWARMVVDLSLGAVTGPRRRCSCSRKGQVRAPKRLGLTRLIALGTLLYLPDYVL